VVFVGIRTPRFIHEMRAFHHVNYVIWQALALRVARRLHRARCFDVVHSVTIGGIRFPSFMYWLGIPMIIGPLGGGEMAPRGLLRGLTLRHRLVEFLRAGSNFFLRLDPLMRATFAGATLILVRTEDTGRTIPRRFQPKIRQNFGIGIETRSILPGPRTANRAEDGTFQVLFVSRLIYWKGGELVLAAFSRLAAVVSEARLTVVGRGAEAVKLRARAKELGIDAKIVWRDDWIDNADLERLYEDHQMMLFPALHEAGGTVVLEALAKALPVVCLDIGGPGQVVGHLCGIAVPTDGVGSGTVVERLADAALLLATDLDVYLQKSRASWEEAQRRSWRNEVDAAYGFLTDVIRSPPTLAADSGRQASSAW
jgi:glycosyltransferase involved in cell wall biosynthesis